MLTKDQIQNYQDNGFIIVHQAITLKKLKAMQDELQLWIEESKKHKKNYGDTPNGKAQFDLEQGHSAENPKLRRVANPTDISQVYRDVLFEGSAIEAVADLIGPNVKFHHCKLNIKLPNMKARVDYHQDHSFDPHTNDDHLTLLILLDDMNEENGCLRVLKGSHKGPRFTHYDGDEYVGKVEEKIQEKCRSDATKIEGMAGDICLMHTWSLHGGTANLSKNPRRMLISDLTAADNWPLMPPMIPSIYSGKIILGEITRRVRFREGEFELPKHYIADSFFGAQGQKGEQKEAL
jgi:ectoine hydroxylase-related dioxygenase (phytanoyl-CoA dioxygenase family)